MRKWGNAKDIEGKKLVLFLQKILEEIILVTVSFLLAVNIKVQVAKTGIRVIKYGCKSSSLTNKKQSTMTTIDIGLDKELIQ